MNSKISLLIIALLGLAFLSMPAKAETKIITVSNESHANYSDPRGSTSQILMTTFNYNYFLFDTGNYSSLVNFTLRDTFNALQFGQPNEVTTCTITVNGSGTCTASYSQFLHQLTWVFSPDTVITGSPFNVTYAHDIFKNVTYTGNGALGEFSTAPAPTSSLNANDPMYPGNFTHIMSHTFTGVAYQKFIFSGIFTSGTVTNTVTITYPNNGYYLATVDKSGQKINTKYFLHTQTNNSQGYFAEATFNINNSQVLMPQLDGIYINLTMGTGDFNDVLINASGSTVVTPTPTPTPPPVLSNNTAGVALSWDKNIYNINDIGTLTGNVTVSPPLLGYFIIRITNSSGASLQSYVWDSSGTFPQVQQVPFSFPYSDTFTANFISHSPLFGESTLVTLSVQAKIPQSYVFAPVTAVTGQKINVSYIYGTPPSLNGSLGGNGGALEDITADEFGFGGIGNYFNISLCPCDTSLHTVNYTINGVGKHEIRLWDTALIKVVASTIVQVTDVGAPSYGNITSNFLGLDNTQYSVNDVINGQYQISSANWSNYSYFKVSLNSSGNIGMGFTTLNSQVGTFQLPVSPGAFNIIQSGAANVIIFGGGSVIDPNPAIMASVPVTILASHNGYSVSTSPVTICLTQPEIVKYTSPNGAGILNEIYMTPAGTTKSNNVSFSSNGTKTFIYNNGVVMNNAGIIYSVYDTSGNFQVNSIIKYQSLGCTPPGVGVTPTPIGTPPTSTQQANSLVGLITSNIFWALIITGGLMILMAFKTKDGFPTAIIGVFASGIFTFIGWLPAWIFFTMFVIGALFIGTSIVEKQVRNVTK